jgi:hypothetical protein
MGESFWLLSFKKEEQLFFARKHQKTFAIP